MKGKCKFLQKYQLIRIPELFCMKPWQAHLSTLLRFVCVCLTGLLFTYHKGILNLFYHSCICKHLNTSFKYLIFSYFINFFNHILVHIYASLKCLLWKTNIYRPKDLSTGSFSIRQKKTIQGVGQKTLEV